MPKGIFQHKPTQGYQKGHPKYGNESFKKGHRINQIRKERGEIYGFQKGHTVIGGFEKGNQFSKGLVPWNKDKECPQETRDKISKANIGKPGMPGELNPTKRPEVREKIRLSRLGKKASIETRKKMSEKRKGSDNGNYKGGITSINIKIRNSIEARLWREAVFARDNFTDQKTGQIGGKLVAHHIQNFAQYPELRFAINNGITLSKENHKAFHHIYGNKNNTREQLEEFLGRLI